MGVPKLNALCSVSLQNLGHSVISVVLDGSCCRECRWAGLAAIFDSCGYKPADAMKPCRLVSSPVVPQTSSGSEPVNRTHAAFFSLPVCDLNSCFSPSCS